MAKETWYSARLRFAVLIDEKLSQYADSLYLLQAISREDAFSEALELGKRRHARYRNKAGQVVTWKLVEIMTLDSLPAELEHGTELYRELCPADDQSMSPERSTPGQTLP